MLIALGDELHSGSVGQVVDHHRQAATQHLSYRVVAVALQGHDGTQTLHLRCNGRVDGGGYGAPDRPAPIDQIDDAQLGEVADKGVVFAKLTPDDKVAVAPIRNSRRRRWSRMRSSAM